MSVYSNLHGQDFYAWTIETANTLRGGKLNELDVDNLIEEMEDMGASQLRQLESRLDVLIMHLLKWQYQAEMQSRSWKLTIKEQRVRIKDHVKENPSLKSKMANALIKSYRYAVIKGAKETELSESIFPKEMPYSLEQILDDNFYPENN